jgi:predicted alpha/beta-fold hydrolase
MVSKRKIFFALISFHTLYVIGVAVGLLYVGLWLPWREPLLYVVLSTLFVVYYQTSGVLEMNIYHDDSVMQHCLINHMPTLGRSAYRPSPWLLNRNLQTLYAALGRPYPNVKYVRELVDHVYPDGEICVLDWARASESQVAEAERAKGAWATRAPSPFDAPPVVVLFHGLTGDSGDLNLQYLTRAFNEKGWDVVIPIRRGCGDGSIKLTRQKHYSYGGLQETEFVVEYIYRKVKPLRRPLIGVGLSAGSNILANYLGTYGSRSRLSGGISVANGYCWNKGTEALRRSPVWDTILQGMVFRTLLHRHEVFKSELTHLEEPIVIPTRQFSSQRDYDEHVARRLLEYKSLEEFYHDQSCATRLHNIAVPTIFLNAIDDPVAHADCIPMETLRKNPSTVLITTASGGHLGWARSLWPFRDMYTWMDLVIVEGVESILHTRVEHAASLQRLRSVSSVGSLVSTEQSVCSPQQGTPTKQALKPQKRSQQCLDQWLYESRGSLSSGTSTPFEATTSSPSR